MEENWIQIAHWSRNCSVLSSEHDFAAKCGMWLWNSQQICSPLWINQWKSIGKTAFSNVKQCFVQPSPGGEARHANAVEWNQSHHNALCLSHKLPEPKQHQRNNWGTLHKHSELSKKIVGCLSHLSSTSSAPNRFFIIFRCNLEAICRRSWWYLHVQC